MAEEKKKRRLSEIFSCFIPVSGAQRELFQLAEDASVRIDSAHRMVEVNFHLPRIFPKNVLYETEAALAEAYAQNSVRLFPHYPPELFHESYISEILMEA